VLRSTAAIAVLLLATPAVAGQGEHHLSLRGSYASAQGHGAGAALAHTWGIDDFWNLTTGAGWSMLPDEPEDVSLQLINVNTGVLYHLDAFQWIPYAALTLGGYAGLADGDAEFAFGFEVGGGIDYRPARRWGIGLWARYNVMVVGDVPNYLTAGLQANLYF